MPDSPGIEVSMIAAPSQVGCSIGTLGKMVRSIEDSDVRYFFPNGIVGAMQKRCDYKYSFGGAWFHAPPLGGPLF